MHNNMEFRPAFFGFETIWFVAKVVSRNDPLKLGRLRIRIFGIHSDSTTDIPDDMLPWAHTLQSINSAAQTEVGMSPTGILNDSVVMGLFMDGKACQQPLIMGTLAGAPGGTSDISRLALGTQTLDKQATAGIEPASPFGAQYPYNKVYQTESGHVIELDDTPGKERVHVYHRAGSYTEIGPDGVKVSKTVGKDFDVVVKDKTVYVGENLNIFVKGNVNIEAYNDVNLNVSGKLNASVEEDIRLKSGGKIVLEGEELDLKFSAINSEPPTIAWGLSAASTGLAAPNPRDIRVYVPSMEDRHGFETDDDGGAGVAALVADGTISPPPNNNANTGRQANTANSTPATSTICGITIQPGQNLDSIQLTPHYTVGKLSSFAEVTHYSVVAQGGLTESDIVCNLKLLAENCLEKILAQYPTAIVTSGFRSPAAASQHTKGQAADIQFTDLNGLAENARRSAYYDRAVWIMNNVPFDQLILEYKTYGTGLPWIHISFNKNNLRRSLLTQNNGSTVSHDIRELLL